MPRVSIGIPVYNGEKYIADAMESLQRQTFRDIELVVSDNASTDGTVEIVRRLAAEDSRIRLIERPENMGAVDNFNHVFRQSNGEYFKWAAADDVCHPEFLKECVLALDQNPDAAWCHCTSDKIDASGRSFLDQMDPEDPTIYQTNEGPAWADFPRPDFSHLKPSGRFASIILGTNWCVDSYGVFRRSALEKTRLCVDLYGAEKVLLAELSLLGKYVHVPRMLFAQRIHLDASSSIDNRKKLEEFIASGSSRPFFSTRVALLRAHSWSVLRQPIGLWEKTKALFGVLRYLFQVHKWSKVLGRAIKGSGNGGGGKRLLQKVKTYRETQG